MQERLKQFEITCPRCGHIFKKDLNTAIFSETMERDKLLNRDFASLLCPSCGHDFRLNYRFIYTDDRLKFMVVNDSDFVGSSHRLALISSLSLLDKLRRDELSKFRTIMTTNLDELREKILILESGLDDRTVELMKYILLESDELSLNHDDVASFVIEEVDKFILTSKTKGVMSLPFPKEVYDKIAETYGSSFDNKPALINRVWAYDFLKKFK